MAYLRNKKARMAEVVRAKGTVVGDELERQTGAEISLGLAAHGRDIGFYFKV